MQEDINGLIINESASSPTQLVEDSKIPADQIYSSPLPEEGGAGSGETGGLSAWGIFKEEIVMLKWRVFIAACILPFGSYYISDFPGSLGTGQVATIQAKFSAEGKEYTQSMNQALYSIYSYPNTFLAIFGGILIDKYLGLRRSSLMFMSFILSSTVIFYLGVRYTSYPVMLMARLLYGLGGESLGVAQSAFVARWFNNRRGMALAFGISILVCRIGASFNFFFSPRIATSFGLDAAVFSGIIATSISAVACVSLVILDYYGESKGEVGREMASDKKGTFRFKDILKLRVEFWLLCTICVLCYCAIFPFIGIAKNFFQVKFDLTGSQASTYVSFFMFTSAAISPIIGGLVDKLGRYPYWLILSTVLFIGIHLTLLVTACPAYVVMVAMGLPYAFLVSGMWPSVPYVVPQNIIGFSYGFMTALQNAGLATFPVITGAILDAYTPKGDCSNSTNGTTIAPTSIPNTTTVLPTTGTNSTTTMFTTRSSTTLTGTNFTTSTGTNFTTSTGTNFTTSTGTNFTTSTGTNFTTSTGTNFTTSTGTNFTTTALTNLTKTVTNLTTTYLNTTTVTSGTTTNRPNITTTHTIGAAFTDSFGDYQYHGYLLRRGGDGVYGNRGDKRCDAGMALPVLTGFHYTELLFIASVAVSCACAIALYFIDRAHGGVLVATPEKRKELIKIRDQDLQSLLSDENQNEEEQNSSAE